MNDQPKPRGAMVLVSRDKLETITRAPLEKERIAIFRWEVLFQLRGLLAAPAEQTPAVGGLDWSKSVYEHCASCKGWLPLLDGSCRPCLELRAALARIAELEAQLRDRL